jgi:RNA polymerase sigma factor (sigma-70 family)
LDVERLLERLASPEPEQTWTEFLESFSPIIFQIVRLTEREPDHISDCFLFICERLSEKRFQRLRRFKPKGRARFGTWLWVVVRNLCRDWHRKEFGRLRVFQSINRLTATDQAVYRCVYEQGLSKEETITWLGIRETGLTRERVDESLQRIQLALTSRQLWLLSVRNYESASLEEESETGQKSPKNQITDPAPDPEVALVLNERYAALEKAFRQLSNPERFLITLRYKKGLTLQEIADLLGLKDAWTADRRLKEVLVVMRKHVDSFSGFSAKTRDASV